ncbi:MAG: acyl phosphate:glycerol-3-phosphate acyltransferase [Betaproteobacteria bacterium]|jgi:glycerol-3-phosphate acyltransferase PlsY|nr:acyl phosphate:glycerol-3-phosphate acyltransferase [Betaproteobacteria bacterium]
MPIALAAIAGYLLGSVSFAVVVTRLMRLPDPRSYGSKNPGATNVLRSGNKLAAVLTLLGDAAKGWLAVAIAPRLASTLISPDCIYAFGPACAPPDEAMVVSAALLAAFLGHLFPVFHRFHGGKGVATAAGVLMGLDWRIGIGTIATWLIIAFFLRYSSLAALVGAVFAPLATIFLLGFDTRAIAVLLISALLIWRHKDNVKRLIAGTESKLGAKKATPPDPSAA